MTTRRLWVLIERWCLKSGTALAVSIHGDRGRWNVTDEILAAAHGVNPPEDKVRVEWKQQQQARIRAKRARIAADRARASGTAAST